MKHKCTSRSFFPRRQGELGKPMAGPVSWPRGLRHHTEEPSFAKGSTVVCNMASQQSCAGIQVPLCSMQHWGYGERSTTGQSQSLCDFSGKADRSCSSPAPRGDQRDFLNRFLIPPQLYPSNTSLRLEMRRLAHLLHKKPEASYILLSSQLAPLVPTHGIKECATISIRQLRPPRPGVTCQRSRLWTVNSAVVQGKVLLMAWRSRQ